MYRQGRAPLIRLCFPLSSKHTLKISQDRQQTLARCHGTITNLGDALICQCKRSTKDQEVTVFGADPARGTHVQVERMVKESKYPSGSRDEV
jgi:hypothetical protein